MRFHSQNLNEEKGITRSMWRHGRCWWHWKDHNRTIGLEWGFWRKNLSFGIGLADYDHAITANFCIGLVNLYFHYDNYDLYRRIRDAIRRKDQTYGSGRKIGFNWFDGMMMFYIWDDPMESRHDDPWWWHFSFTPRDFFLGKPDYSTEIVRRSRIEISMPEGIYHATTTFEKATWKRPRWPWPVIVMRCEIVPDVPIPFPGKGENSWDCGEDAVHSMTTCASTDQEAASAIINSVLRDRYKYGGGSWRPENVAI